ncbi:MAG: long-chain fatty acid--CoA ligase, partial [Phycisphaerae bacterium]
AHRSRDGYVTIVGRCMSVIDVAGEKVFPEEVQGVIDQHPQVSSSRVIGRPHPYFGEIVQAEIVPVDPCEPVCTEELIAFCRKRLSSFKVPQSVSIVERIEQTASDKKCHSQTGLS